MSRRLLSLGCAALLCVSLFVFLACRDTSSGTLTPSDTSGATETDAMSTATPEASLLLPTEGDTEEGAQFLSTGGGQAAYEHGVMGKGVGVNPGRVVWAYNPESVDWDGKGFWWNPSNFDTDVIDAMMEHAVTSLAGKDSMSEAWDALFTYHNGLSGDKSGYKSGEKIAIKVNMNGVGDSTGNTNVCFTSPAVLKALLTQLVETVGVKASDITVYDASRVIPAHLIDYCSQGVLSEVNFKYYDKSGKNDCGADKSVPVVWSQDFEGEVSYLPTCLTQAKYLINIANLKGHNLAGVTLCAKNHFGTIMNSSRNNPPQAAGIHPFAAAHDFNAGEGWTWPQLPMGSYTALVDLISNKNLGGKTVLYINDALFTSITQQSDIGLDCRWQSEPFKNDWPSSIFMSQDPVAIDSVGIDFLTNEPIIKADRSAMAPDTTLQNYIHEAALVSSPPSGAVYMDGTGNVVENLGVHEHWNNAQRKEYSRNLGGAEGIELVRVG